MVLSYGTLVLEPDLTCKARKKPRTMDSRSHLLAKYLTNPPDKSESLAKFFNEFPNVAKTFGEKKTILQYRTSVPAIIIIAAGQIYEKTFSDISFALFHIILSLIVNILRSILLYNFYNS